MTGECLTGEPTAGEPTAGEHAADGSTAGEPLSRREPLVQRVAVRWREHCRQAGERGDDRGTATAFVVGFAVVLLAFAGLVVDGGLAINARQRVADHAEQAARAGSQAIDLESLRSGTAVRLDPVRARTAVADYLSVHGYTADSVRVDAGTNGVSITIAREEPTLLLSLVGFTSFHIEATAQARPAVGIETEF